MTDAAAIQRIIIERELYRRGNLSHLFHAGQNKIAQRIAESPHQVQVVLCARGYGKTFLGVAQAVAHAIRKRSMIKIATEFYTDLENFILPNFEAVLSDCPPDIRPVWKASKGKWIFPNGSEISLIGLDRKPNGLRGTHKVDLIILEEAGFISKLENIYYSVIVPTTMHRPDCKILLLTTPPEGLDHYFWTFYDRAEQEGSLSVYTIDENPMLTADAIRKIEKDMGGRDTTAFQREYLCKRIAEASRQLVPEFSKENHVSAFERPSYFEYLYKTESLDSGVRDLTVQLFSVYDFPTGILHIEDEMVLRGNEVLTPMIYERTAQIEKNLGYHRVARWADNDNLILLNDLNALGDKDGSSRHWSPTSKDSVEAGVNLVRSWFKQNRIRVNPRCRTLIGTLETGLWNKRRDDFERSAVYGHADALSALIYLIRNVNTYDNPIPVSHQMDLGAHIVFQSKALQGNAKSISSAFQLKGKK